MIAALQREKAPAPHNCEAYADDHRQSQSAQHMKITRRGSLVGLLFACVVASAFLLWQERRYRPPGDPENYSRIEEGLYMGGLVPKPPQGTRAVLNLCETEDPYRCDVHAWEAIRDAAPAPDL